MTRIEDLSTSAAIWHLHSGQFPERNHAEELRLRDYVSRTERFVGVWGGFELLGIFGFARPSIVDEQGYCWFLQTSAIARHKIGFLRAARKVAKQALLDYGEVVGVCVTRNAVEWLQWVGAEFAPPNKAGWFPFVIRNVNG